MDQIVFSYRGRTPTGETIKGQFTGDREEFLRQLHSQGIVLLQVKEVSHRRQSGRFKEEDFLNAVEQLYHLLQAGMRIDTALKTLIASLQKEQAYRFWSVVLDKVRQGVSFSSAIQAASKDVTGWKVPGLYGQIIAIGENVGDIPSSLERLIAHLEFRRSLTSELRAALAYPAFLLVMSLVSIVIVVLVIVPRFASVFTPAEIASLPLISKLVFSLADISGSGLRMLIVVPLIVLLTLWLFREKMAPVLKRAWIEALNRFPLTEKAARHLDLSDVYTAIGSMLSGNVALPLSLTQASATARLPALRFLLEQTAAGVKQGQSMHSVWAASSLIPPGDNALVAVGESSANLGSIFLKMGQRHLEQFRVVVRGLLSIFEPMMILSLGCVIGLVVTGILLAVLSMTDVPGM